MNTNHRTSPPARHKPEPWHVHNHVHVHGPAEQRIATIQGEFGDPGNSATARRIVACVNACAGISTAALEHGIVARLKKDLQHMLWRFEGIEHETGEPDETIEEARGTLADAQGGPYFMPYFIGKSGERYAYDDVAKLICDKAPETLGEHIRIQLAAIGLLEEFDGGVTPCGLPFAFA